MRACCAVVLLSAWAACSKATPPPPTPMVEAPTEQAEEEPVTLPTRPTPAFVPSDNGTCMRAYRLVDGTCVHRFYEQTNPNGLDRALTLYKRGVAPPMLGPMPVPPISNRRARAPLGPGSLTKTRIEGDDAGSSRERRLAELDVMLTAAREKLRQRDEASKAKQVENAPKKQRATAAGEPTTSANALAQSAGAGGSGNDPAQARISELSQLASQLSGDQLRQLTAELGKSGINTSELESILSHGPSENGLH